LLCTFSWNQGADAPRSPRPPDPKGADFRRFASETGAIYGLVRDQRGPVAGARVRFQGAGPATLTDAQGRFWLPLVKDSTRVVAWKEGSFIASTTADRTSVAGTLATLLPLVRIPLCCPADRLPVVLTLKPLPAEDCVDYRWVDPAPDAAKAHNCANCHGEI